MTIHTDQTTTSNNIYVRDPGEGQHLHVLDNLATIKTVAGSGQAMAVVEFTAPRDFGPPRHVHEDEDEFMYVLDGELEVWINDCPRTVSAGSFVWLPRAVPHTFQVVSETARMLSVTAVALGPEPRFDTMLIRLGDEVDEPTVPAPMDIDPAAVSEVSSDYGVQIVGPPPAPRS